MATLSRAALTAGACLSVLPQPAFALAQHQGHDAPAPAPAPVQTDPHAGHDVSTHPPAAPATASEHESAPGSPHHHPTGDGRMSHVEMGPGSMPTSPLGPWPMSRDASGTSWQPDASEHGGVHRAIGDWTIMSHALLNLTWDRQDGPRGDDKTFISGMMMGAARRDFTDGSTLNLRAMLTPDPLMGKRGFPLLLAAGETADGVAPLVDRQHPHELVMELSASYSRPLTPRDTVFAYVGLPGAPAFGPPAFMHRMSAMDSPEAPITHHWLDSTHIVFGVATVGWVRDGVKLEVSAFRGREPDQDRYDIERPDLDSVAIRASWNPSPEWSLQASWADVTSPEQLHPDEDEIKWSASAIHTRRLGPDGWWSTTLAWGRKTPEGDEPSKDAWLLESAVHPDDAWTVFARAERTETDELFGHHGDIHTVAKASIGAVRDWRVAPRALFGLGALYAVNRVPEALEPSYGGDPDGAMVFVRLKID